MGKIDHALFEAHSHALAEAFGDCPECQSTLVIRRSKSGPFIGCSDYPQCTFSKPLHDNETHIIKVMEKSHCPECKHPLAVKKGRYGLFIGCTNMPECHHIESLKQQQKTSVLCPSCGEGKLVHKTNRFGKAFWSCTEYPSCKYIINHEPHSESCQHCGWGILITAGDNLKCPQPKCGKTQ